MTSGGSGGTAASSRWSPSAKPGVSSGIPSSKGQEERPDLLRSYAQMYAGTTGESDELLLANGAARPHWLPLIHSLSAHHGTLRDIGRETRRLVDELGVTYHVYSDPEGVQRPWPLDAIPQLLTAEEWVSLERALVQRARLFEWILKDILGPQELLRAGILPPEFLAAHGAYLPVLRNTLSAEGPALSLYAADLARGPDGRFWVIGDRTQSPSGAGYALQNREILSRTWPRTFMELGVRGLGRFFRGLRQGLRDLVPHLADPCIVLLSPGPLNEVWFEHVLLARQLGILLVQGQDMVFRDGRIWLSTLGQLEPVDVILRRVDDAWCDPLSLHPYSCLGVAGLLEAVRRKTVVVANALGSSLLESPAWPAFLPAIARFALGEPLLLPSVATWWCGEPEGLERVLHCRDSLVIRSIDRSEGGRPIFIEELSKEDRQRLCARIQAQPTHFVGQERVGLSTMPCLGDTGVLEARHGTVRVFTCQCSEGFVVLPGGLCRVAGQPGVRLVSNQEGGVSKDTWVLRPSGEVTARDATLPEAEAGIMDPESLSRRVADNLLWVGRYAERAEALVRWLRLVLRRLQINRFEHRLDDPVTRAMLRALTHLSGSYPGFTLEAATDKDSLLTCPDPELLRLLCDPQVPGSVPAALNALQNAANAVRDRLSSESVRVFTGLREGALPLLSLQDPMAAEGSLGDLSVHLLALAGLSHESILHHHGWRFLDAGRRFERGMLLVNLLRATLVTPLDARSAMLLNDMVLAFAESLSVFRALPTGRRTAAGLLDLLLLEPENPRALIYQLDRLLEHVQSFPGQVSSVRLPEYLWHLEEARARLRLARVEEWAPAEGTVRHSLEELLMHQFQKLAATYQAVFAQFLAPVATLPRVVRSLS